jgi:PAS domain S-box-containing protein
MNKICIKNFKTKLALFLIVAAFVPISALEVISMFDQLKYEQLVFEQLEDGLVENHVKLFDYWLLNNQIDLSAMAVIVEENIQEDSTLASMEPVLDILLLRNDSIINTFYTSEEGVNLLCNSQKPLVDGRNRKWYKEAIKTGVAVSEPYEDAITGQQVLTFSHVIEGEDGIEGVLGVDILFSQIMKRYIDTFNYESTEMVITRRSGEVVFQTKPFLPEDISYFQSIKDQNIGFFTPEVVINKLVPSLNLEVFVIIDRFEYFNRGMIYKKLIDRDLALGSILFCTILLAAYLVARRVTKPISQLEKNVKEIVGNENMRNHYLGYKDLDEIIDLFIEFQNTICSNTKSIIKMEGELEERNQTLTSLNTEYEKAFDELESFSRELSEKESSYEMLVENIVDLIWSVDASGTLTYCNEKMLEALGYEESEFTGKSLLDIVPSFGMNYGNSTYELLHTRDYDAIDMEFIDKKNEKVILTSTSTTRVYQNGQLSFIQGVSRDVTLEKKMFDELNSRNHDLMLINRIGKEMTLTDDLESVLNLILDNVDALFEISIASIRVLDGEGLLKVRALKGNEKGLLWAAESPEAMNSHIGYAIKQNQPVVINSIEDIVLQTDDRMIDMITKGYKIVVLPLSNSNHSNGALSIISIDVIDDRILEVLTAFANSTSVAMERAILFETLQKNYLKTIEMLMTALEAKNEMMQGHSNRVSRLSEYIGQKLHLSEQEVKDIYISGLLHDVGKIGLRDAVLRNDFAIVKPNKDSELISSHIEIGKRILAPINLKKSIMDGVYYHHKRFDQSGYPEDQLKEVPLFALIIGLADDIDIMMKRIIKQPLSITEMKEVLVQGSGTKYSPEIVNLMVELIDAQDEKLLNIINGRM